MALVKYFRKIKCFVLIKCSTYIIYYFLFIKIRDTESWISFLLIVNGICWVINCLKQSDISKSLCSTNVIEHCLTWTFFNLSIVLITKVQFVAAICLKYELFGLFKENTIHTTMFLKVRDHVQFSKININFSIALL